MTRSTLYTRIAAGTLAIHKDGKRTFALAVKLARYLETLNAAPDEEGRAGRS